MVRRTIATSKTRSHGARLFDTAIHLGTDHRKTLPGSAASDKRILGNDIYNSVNAHNKNTFYGYDAARYWGGGGGGGFGCYESERVGM